MGDRRLTAGIVGFFVIILLSLALWSALRGDEGDKDDEGKEVNGDGEDDENDHDEENGNNNTEDSTPDVKFHIGDMFYADRIDSRWIAGPSMRWLTIWLTVENPSPNGSSVSIWTIFLETGYSAIRVMVAEELVNNSFTHSGEYLAPYESIGGWIHFPVRLYEEPRRLAYNRSH